MSRLTSKIAFFLILPLGLFAQLPADTKGEGLLRKEWSLGAVIATDGWGLQFNWLKQKSARYKHMYGGQITTIRHPKEVKSFTSIFQNSRGYYYGKLNSLIALRPYFGGKRILFEPVRDQGVQISWIWSAGMSFGLVKPVYLKIQQLPGGEQTGITEERYTPEIHHVENIYGRSSWFKGLGQSSLAIGTFFRSGVFFDLSVRKFALWGIEIGVQMDVFTSRIPLMYATNDRFIFPSLYVQLALGRRLM
jgi:hypothetical protein